MTIAENKIRTIITIDKADKKAMEQLAEKEDRSFNYLVNRAIKEYLQNNAPESK